MKAFGTIIALVVTYNRKELVTRCLTALTTQTELADRIFLLDNGSTDGTSLHLRERGFLEHPRVTCFSVRRNIGPAAGFDLLIRRAYEAGADWIWVLDDDTIPALNALAELKAAFAANFSRPEEVGFLASMIFSEDGQPNNVPDIDTRAAPGRCADWGKLLANGLVKLRWSTLCSSLIPRSTLARVGSLCPQFYFSGDDIDFALRITETLPIYLVGRSRAVHLRAVTGTFSILKETDPERIRMFVHFYRNNVYIRRRYYSRGRVVMFIGKCGWELIRCLAMDHVMLRLGSILRGVSMGLVFKPAYRPIEPSSTPGQRRDEALHLPPSATFPLDDGTRFGAQPPKEV